MLQILIREKLVGMNDILRLEVTDRCNLLCDMCWSSEWMHREMSWHSLRSLIYDYNNIGGRCIVLTSREPLLSKNFLNIVELCKKLSIDLKILTNATLISKEMAEYLVGCNNINFIAISLHGNEKVHDKIVGVKGTYNKVIRAISFLYKYRKIYNRKDLEIRLTTVISKYLLKDIDTILSITTKFHTSLRIQHYMWQPLYIQEEHIKYLEQKANCTENIISDFNSCCDINYKDVIKLIQYAKRRSSERQIDFQTYPNLYLNDIKQWYSNNIQNYLKYKKSSTMFCDHAMNSIRIRANGEVSFCQYINLNLGNILNQSLHCIIEKKEIRNFRERVYYGELFPICYHCCHVKVKQTNNLPTDNREI